jgi:hypothetical protein
MSYLEPAPKPSPSEGFDILSRKADIVKEVDVAYPYWTKVKYLATKYAIEPK